jgi:hypothetical protein
MTGVDTVTEGTGTEGTGVGGACHILGTGIGGVGPIREPGIGGEDHIVGKGVGGAVNFISIQQILRDGYESDCTPYCKSAIDE